MLNLSGNQEEEENSTNTSFEVTLTRLRTLGRKAGAEPMREQHAIAIHHESRPRYLPAIDFTAKPLTNEERPQIKAYVGLQAQLIGKQGGR